MFSTRNRKRLDMPIPCAITCCRRGPRALERAPLFPRYPLCRVSRPFPAATVLSVTIPLNAEGSLPAGGTDTGSRVERGSLVARVFSLVVLSLTGSLARVRASRGILACLVAPPVPQPAASETRVQPPLMIQRYGLRGSDDVYSPSRDSHNRRVGSNLLPVNPPSNIRGFSFSGAL